MALPEVSLNNSNSMKVNLALHWATKFFVTRSANLNASLKMRRAEGYLQRHMETLISAAKTKLIKKFPKDSLFNVVSRDPSFLEDKSSVSLLLVPSFANLRF